MEELIKNSLPGFDEKSLAEKFKILTNAFPDCIKIFNLDNKVEYMNPGGLAEHGFKSMKDAIGFDWTKTVVPEQREEIRQKIKESIDERKTVFLDVEHLPEFANREWCAMVISPIFDDQGNITSFIGVSRDITARKHSEERVKEYLREVESLNKMMIDRELRMIELKKEYKDLEEECKSGEKNKPVV